MIIEIADKILKKSQQKRQRPNYGKRIDVEFATQQLVDKLNLYYLARGLEGTTYDDIVEKHKWSTSRMRTNANVGLNLFIDVKNHLKDYYPQFERHKWDYVISEKGFKNY